MTGFYKPLAGKGLVLGSTRSGETAAAKTTLRAGQVAVTFLESHGRLYVPTLIPRRKKD